MQIQLSKKEQLRQRAKNTLAALSPADKKQQSDHICQQLYKYINEYNSWAVYIPFAYEPDIFPFVQQLWEQNKTVLIPQLDGEQLRLAHYTNENIIAQGVYGEGIIQNPVWYDGSVDVCLIPGLFFDNQGRRIGHGKGRYDRFLAKNNCYRIGVGYKEIIRKSIPHDEWDQQMHVVIANQVYNIQITSN